MENGQNARVQVREKNSPPSLLGQRGDEARFSENYSAVQDVSYLGCVGAATVSGFDAPGMSRKPLHGE